MRTHEAAAAAPVTMDETDRQLMRLTQQGLPLVARPFLALARDMGVAEAEVLRRMRQLLQLGVVRRIGAVPNHYRLGIRANGMTVWNVRDADISEAGKQIGDLPFVSHCYHRPRRPPAWPYNLFAMLHARERDEVLCLQAQISDLLGERAGERDVLFSRRILKKTGLRLQP